MGKKRIHELAKELSLTSAELIQKIIEWKLLPGVKLVASSGLEDYLADDIARRLKSGSTAEAAAPQVVRRRKKNQAVPQAGSEAVESPEAEALRESADQERPEAPAWPEPESGTKPVTAPKVYSEAAVIVGSIRPSVEREPLSPPEPALAPELPAAPSPAPEPVQAAPSVPEVPVASAEKNSASAPEAKPQAPKPAPRKITRELSDPPARIIGTARPGFDVAKAVSVKPNWKDAPAPRRPQVGPEEARPAWADRKPGGPVLRPAEFRRPEPVATPPAPETESRRRDKKKKNHSGSRFDNDEMVGKPSRRRDVVERTDLYSEGDWERVRRRGKGVKKLKSKVESTVPKAIKRRIKVDEAITVSELAHRLAIKAGDIIKKLMALGVMAGLNQALDFDTASLVASDFGYEVEKSAFDEGNILQLEYGEASPDAVRPPVVTIMGHVDHGKTSLLDYIRKTNIQSGEAGGITQHIGAYHVSAGGRNITFLDTPGHEAFTAMRSRGAQVTDIVILIVAADDGLMPQTREAADHARAAGVPIVVAVNKIDKPAANPDQVRREMMEIGLVPEEWGGETVFVNISAKTGQGVDELLDMILLQADILELTARPDGPAKGHIIEARLDKGRGPVATVLVQQGLLKQGDSYVCGAFYGRIRAMLNDQGDRVSEAGPAIPVEVQGISGVPQAGDEFIVLPDEKQARQVSQHRQLKQRENELIKTSRLTLENLFDNIKAGAVKGLNLIIKTDVQGSLEAISEAVAKLSTPEMKINIIHQSTGAVSETDIMLASASHALVICFGVRHSAKVQEIADNERIQIRYYDVIYKLIDDIKEAMAGLLDPVKSEKVLGRAEVRQTFMVTKVGVIAGSFVSDGKVQRGARVRLLRDGVVVYDGRISSLRREKDDVREVASGYECGIGLENFNDIKVGDQIEPYQIEETAATVELVNEAVARAARDRDAKAKATEAEGEN